MLWVYCRSALVSRASYKPTLKVEPADFKSFGFYRATRKSRPKPYLKSRGHPAAFIYSIPDVPVTARPRRKN